MPSRPREESLNNAAITEKVQTILRSRKLTLYAVSQQSAALYGRSSPYFVPHNLYYDLRSEKFSPSVHQIFSLSRISGYRFGDWLRVFGFDLENITRLQVQLPAKRTILLDTTLTDPNEWISWFSNRISEDVVPTTIAPLARLLKRIPPRRTRGISELNQQFLFAKVGHEDALAFPDLVPGSIVRVDPLRARSVSESNCSMSDRIFLVEHSKGYFCCRIRLLPNGVIVPVDNRLDYAQVELHCPQEARIHGVVDLELRPLLDAKEPDVPAELARRWRPQPLLEPVNLGQLLKMGRLRLRISIRGAANATRIVAKLMNDDRYFISASSLSDYELDKTSPRDFHKIITLGSIYGLHFDAMMKAMSLDLGQSGSECMPDRYLSRTESLTPDINLSEGRRGFLEWLLYQCQNDVPFFLRDVLGYFSGSAPVSIDDFFWIGGNQDVLHPTLTNGLVVLLNRRRKAPIHFLSKPIWQQPIFVVLKRDGSYLAAGCSLENRTLVVHCYGPAFHGIEYRLHRDAEIVGQIVAIARRFT